MPIVPRADIFVSSTSCDLRGYRQAVIDTILSLGHHAVAMEHYGAVDQTAVEKCLADVRSCDAFIGVLAWRYGFVPDGYDQSMSELEYREAESAGIPRYVFLLDENTPWPPLSIDRDRSRIEALRCELQNSRVVAYFNSPDTLAKEVAAALARALPGREPHPVGKGIADQHERRQFLHQVMLYATKCRNDLRAWLTAHDDAHRVRYADAVTQFAQYLYERQLLTPSAELYEQLHLYKRQAEPSVPI